MTVYNESYVDAGDRSDLQRTVDIAGTQWPLYKIRALVLGTVAAILIFALTMSAQPAVLGGAAVTVIAWWSMRIAATGVFSALK